MGGWVAYILNVMSSSGPVVALPDTLMEAIRNRILADSTIGAAVGTNVYNRKTQAKSRITFPMIVVNQIAEYAPDIFTGGDYYTAWNEIQFCVLDTDEDEAVSLRDLCFKLFRPSSTNLLWTDGTMASMVPGRKWEQDQQGTGPGGLTVWGAFFTLRIYCTRTFL